MKIARTIGTVTLSRSHPSMVGARLRCVEIVDSADRVDANPIGGESVIAWDLCGAGDGDLVALAEGPEAAAPLSPETVPVDASVVALLDNIDLT